MRRRIGGTRAVKSQPGKPECPRTAQHKILYLAGWPHYAVCIIQDSREPLQILVVLLGLREGETGVARLLRKLGRLWGDSGEIGSR